MEAVDDAARLRWAAGSFWEYPTLVTWLMTSLDGEFERKHSSGDEVK